MKCRHCAADLVTTFVDLGSAPPSNALLTEATLKGPESWFPLHVLVCSSCRLVQTEDFAAFDSLFDPEYTYFSSFSTTWLDHSRRYVDRMAERFGLGPESFVVEVAANDGYLLQFVKAAGIRCLGVEPTASTARAARQKGLDIIESFFGEDLGRRIAAKHGKADLTAANNVLAHVPDINDFARGFAALLSDQGVSTFEFPWLLNLIKFGQFDTIYHEHFSYLSLWAVERIFAAAGLSVFDVEELSTHGGSLRVFAQRSDTGRREISAAVEDLRAQERSAGVDGDALYEGFQARSDEIKDGLLRFLLDAKAAGKSVAGYGAAAKGNTLMNYAGIRPDLVRFVVDRNPAKQGRFLPGSRIPIRDEAALREERPDYILVLPWNLKDEIVQQLSYARDWGAQFVVAVPELTVS